MGEGTTLAKGDFVKREIQRWIADIELCIALPNFGWLDAEHFLVELETLLHVLNVDRQMRLQCFDFGIHIPSCRIRLCVYDENTDARHICQDVYIFAILTVS